MQTEILNKLKELLKSEDVLAVRREFNSLRSQFRSLPDEPPAAQLSMSEEKKTNPAPTQFAPAPENISSDAISQSTTGPEKSEDEESKTSEKEKPEVSGKAETSEKEKVKPDSEKLEEPGSVHKSDGEIANGVESITGIPSGNNGESEETDRTSPPHDEVKATEKIPQEQESQTDSLPGDESTENREKLQSEFKEVVATFKKKLDAARKEKQRIEESTIASAKDLLEEMKTLVQDEENIGKAFSRFNAIREKWKSLPEVSNEAYRDLNAEYNKLLEEFFYNINIYKELKELDLKHNLEQKQLVLVNQKKLLDQNDIRILELEVRLNQNKWNEIGPTFKEEWDKLKDEFWTVTRSIYKRIQDFYRDRRDEQEKNLTAKNKILNTVKQWSELDLKSAKKWHDKSEEIKNLQKEWRMVGFVPKEESKKINREFRKVCDVFFDRKRTFFEEIKKVQDANRDIKANILSRAEQLKDSEDWGPTSKTLIALQKEWKNTGAAHQRDENKMWKSFRAACDHFFKKRNEHKAGRGERETKNLEAKNAFLDKLDAFNPTEANNALEALKEFGNQWREIGHVPFKEKDAINKRFMTLMDAKYDELNIDRRERKKLRFEEHVENLKEANHGERLMRKEEDIIRNKINKLQSEIDLLENNIGFFADSKGAEKLKHDVEKKIEAAARQVDLLKEQLTILRNA